jgi:pimeloyl-ACP methyl ester carboxylesterase
VTDLLTSVPTYREADVPGGLHVGIWEPDEPVGTVLAIHGVTSSHRAFPAIARALPDYRIVAPDLRGRGRSNHLAGPYGMARHADDVAAVLDHLGIDHVLPVGHSMGAFVSLVFADRHPGRCDRLVLVDGGMPLELPAGISADQSIAAILGPAAQRLSMTFPSRDAYQDLWRSHPAFGHLWNDDVVAYADYDLSPVADGGFRPATAYEALAADTVDLAEPEGDLVRAIQRLAVPAFLLQAERGMLDQPEGLYRDDYLAQWEEAVPRLRVRKVSGVNHYTIVFDDRGVSTIAEAVRGR